MINKRAREQAKKYGQILKNNPTANRLGSVALACPISNDYQETLNIYNKLRPELYGRLMPIITGTVNYAFSQSHNRPPHGLRAYKYSKNNNLNWNNINNALYQSLKMDADELFVNNPDTQEKYIKPLQDIMQCTSTLIIGAHSEPAVAISYGIDTAVSSATELAHSMNSYLNSQYPKFDEADKFKIINNSHKIINQLALCNLEQIDILGRLWSAKTAMQTDFEFLEDKATIILSYGQLANKPISTGIASNANLVNDVDLTKAKIRDLDKPFSHIGCPITFEPDMVNKLWHWSTSAMYKGGLFNS